MKGSSPSQGCGEVSANGNKCHDGISDISSTPRKGKSMSIITVGIDFAKNVFALHGVDDNGNTLGWLQWRSADSCPVRGMFFFAV